MVILKNLKKKFRYDVTYIQRPYRKAVPDYFVKKVLPATFKKTCVLKDFVDRDLNLRDVYNAKCELETFLRTEHFSPYRSSICAQSLYKFIEELRRFFVSDDMRKKLKRESTLKVKPKNQNCCLSTLCPYKITDI